MSEESPESFRDLMLAENPGFDDVAACVFGLGSRDIECYFALCERPESSANALADALERDRTTVTRTLDTLREKGLAERRRELLESGGQRYCYRATALEEVRERMHEELDAWTASVHGRIRDFEEP